MGHGPERHRHRRRRVVRLPRGDRGGDERGRRRLRRRRHGRRHGHEPLPLQRLLDPRRRLRGDPLGPLPGELRQLGRDERAGRGRRLRPQRRPRPQPLGGRRAGRRHGLLGGHRLPLRGGLRRLLRERHSLDLRHEDHARVGRRHVGHDGGRRREALHVELGDEHIHVAGGVPLHPDEDRQQQLRAALPDGEPLRRVDERLPLHRREARLVPRRAPEPGHLRPRRKRPPDLGHRHPRRGLDRDDVVRHEPHQAGDDPRQRQLGLRVQPAGPALPREGPGHHELPERHHARVPLRERRLGVGAQQQPRDRDRRPGDRVASERLRQLGPRAEAVARRDLGRVRVRLRQRRERRDVDPRPRGEPAGVVVQHDVPRQDEPRREDEPQRAVGRGRLHDLVDPRQRRLHDRRDASAGQRHEADALLDEAGDRVAAEGVDGSVGQLGRPRDDVHVRG
ncbi:MAG: hypothetical protein HMLKMBBP_02691 [Planctomycetes bacterium]|nr:hypothetical protein [Planctomycetota bacterium]